MHFRTVDVISGGAAWLLGLAGLLMAVAASAQMTKPATQQEAAPAIGDATKTVDRAQAVVWRLDVDVPDSKLAKLLSAYLDLARFQEEAGQDASLGIRRSELRRLVVSAPEQARSLLEAEGYFNAVIHTKVSDEQTGQPVVVTMQVDPGPRTSVSKVQFIFEGDLDERLSASDPLAQALLDRLERNWTLPEGEPFRQADWSSAKNGALARLRAEGYPTATWSGTSVTVDPDQHTAKLYLVADTGPAFAFGDIRVEGLVKQPASAVTNLAPFKKGAAYSEKQLIDWQERIQKLNLFDSVFVNTDLDPTQAAASPVVVQVHELPLQVATTGIGVSSDTGPRVSAEYLNRNPFGSDWQAKTKLQLGSKESVGKLDLTSHPWPNGRQGLISGQASYLVDVDGSVTSSQEFRVGQLRAGERLERTNYIEVLRAQVRSYDKVIVSSATAAAGTSQWTFRDVDSLSTPTKGTTSVAALTGGRTYSALYDDGYFGRAYAKVVGYLPWGAWRAIGRAEVGQVFARDTVSVPDTLLFRAGGDDSVRGYPYRSLGVEKDGVVIGGRSLFTGSMEVAHPVSKSLPSLLGALFIDAGDAADRFGNLEPKVGYGFGARYLSPVGPLRLDVAYGTHLQRWRLHFSVGVAL